MTPDTQKARHERARKFWHDHALNYDGPTPDPWNVMADFAAAEYALGRNAGQIEESKALSVLRKICRNSYTCHYQKNTFPGECDPCGICHNCMADEELGDNWRTEAVASGHRRRRQRSHERL